MSQALFPSSSFLTRPGLNPGSLLALLIGVDLFLCVVAMTLGRYPGQFFKEGSYMSWYSFAHLLAMGLITAQIFRIRRSALPVPGGLLGQPAFIWGLMTVGFVFLAFDEGFRFHESLNGWIISMFQLPRNAWTDRIDDLIVGAYGIAAIGVMGLCRAELSRYRGALPWLLIGFAMVAIMIALDLVSHRLDFLQWLLNDYHVAKYAMSWLRAVEEVFKLLAEAFFIGTGLFCLEMAKNKA